MKKAVIFTAMLAGALAFGFSQTAYTVRNAAGWVEAVNGIRNGGNDQEYTITVTGNINVPASADSTFGSVTGITVTIEGSGTLSPSSNGGLLVIGKDQTVVAKDLTLKGRAGNNASVVQITEGGTFRMEGKASVTGNKVSSSGGGSTSGGGGVLVNGTFIMLDSASVSGNSTTFVSTSTTSSYGGGGVYVNERGIFTMEGGTISGNTSTSSSSTTNPRSSSGGGVYVNEQGTFTMLGGTISGNTSTSSSSFSSYVSSSSISSISSSGGGVHNKGTFTMQGGTISGNTSTSSSIFDMEKGIRSSSPLVSVSLSSSSGGGVYNNGTFTMQDNASVSGNKSSSSVSSFYALSSTASFHYSSGGGVSNGGTFAMKDSASVSGNTSSLFRNTFGGSSSVEGGGVHNSGLFTMHDSAQVSGNTGGGVYVRGGSFTMHDNAKVSDNTAAFSGGGVYVGGNDNGRGDFARGTFTMKDSASVSGNTASYSGGGVYVGGGTFVIQDIAQVFGNTATNSGGGVSVSVAYYEGSKRVSGTFTKTGGTIYGDDADQKLKNTAISRLGHTMYDEENKVWRNAGAGSNINSDSYGFWPNDGDVPIFPSGFAGLWQRTNFNNRLSLTENTVKSSSSDYLWVLQKISGNAYTLKRVDAANTMTITIRLTEDGNLVISGDSGSGENNWNGTWRKW